MARQGEQGNEASLENQDPSPQGKTNPKRYSFVQPQGGASSQAQVAQSPAPSVPSPGYYFAGANQPGFNPDPKTVKIAQEYSRILAGQDPNPTNEWQDAYASWADFIQRGVHGAPVIGHEDSVSGVIGEAEGALKSGGEFPAVMMEAIRTSIGRDVREWSKHYGLPKESFKVVGEKNGVPVVRIPLQEFTDRLEKKKGEIYYLDSDQGGYLRGVSPKAWDLYQRAQSGDKDAKEKWNAILKESVDLHYQRPFDTSPGRPDLVLFSDGAIPVDFLDSPWAKRRQAFWQTGSPEVAKKQAGGSAIMEGLRSFASTYLMTRLLGGPGAFHQEQEDRGIAMLGTPAERNLHTAGGLAAFVTPMGGPSKIVGAGTKVAEKAVANAGTAALRVTIAKKVEKAVVDRLETLGARGVKNLSEEATKKAVLKVSEQAFKKTLVGRTAHFLGKASSRVAGFMAYEKIRPQTGAEKASVDMIKDAYIASGVSREAAGVLAESNYSAAMMEGALKMVGTIEAISPALAFLSNLSARGILAASKKTLGAAARRLGKAEEAAPGAAESAWKGVLEARAQQTIAGALHGVGLGAGLAGIDPKARESLLKWLHGDDSEKTWNEVVSDWMISGTIFGLQGALGAYVGATRGFVKDWEGKLGERYRTLTGKSNIPTSVIRDIEASTARVERRLDRLNEWVNQSLKAEIAGIRAMGESSRPAESMAEREKRVKAGNQVPVRERLSSEEFRMALDEYNKRKFRYKGLVGKEAISRLSRDQFRKKLAQKKAEFEKVILPRIEKANEANANERERWKAVQKEKRLAKIKIAVEDYLERQEAVRLKAAIDHAQNTLEDKVLDRIVEEEGKKFIKSVDPLRGFSVRMARFVREEREAVKDLIRKAAKEAGADPEKAEKAFFSKSERMAVEAAAEKATTEEVAKDWGLKESDVGVAVALVKSKRPEVKFVGDKTAAQEEPPKTPKKGQKLRKESPFRASGFAEGDREGLPDLKLAGRRAREAEDREKEYARERGSSYYYGDDPLIDRLWSQVADILDQLRPGDVIELTRGGTRVTVIGRNGNLLRVKGPSGRETNLTISELVMAKVLDKGEEPPPEPPKEGPEPPEDGGTAPGKGGGGPPPKAPEGAKENEPEKKPEPKPEPKQKPEKAEKPKEEKPAPKPKKEEPKEPETKKEEEKPTPAPKPKKKKKSNKETKKSEQAEAELLPGVKLTAEMVDPEDLVVDASRFQRERRDIKDEKNQVNPEHDIFKKPWDDSAYLADPIIALEENGKFVVVAGHHRRARALGLHGSPDTPEGKILVRVIRAEKGVSKEDVEKVASDLALKTNTGRKQLSKFDLVDTVVALKERGLTNVAIAKKINGTPEKVAHILALSKLPKSVLAMAEELGSEKIQTIAFSFREFKNLWAIKKKVKGTEDEYYYDTSPIQRYLVSNFDKIKDMSVSQFKAYIENIQNTYKAIQNKYKQDYITGFGYMKMTPEEIAKKSFQVAEEYSNLLENLQKEKSKLESISKLYSNPKTASEIRLVQSAKDLAERAGRRLRLFQAENGLIDIPDEELSRLRALEGSFFSGEIGHTLKKYEENPRQGGLFGDDIEQQGPGELFNQPVPDESSFKPGEFIGDLNKETIKKVIDLVHGEAKTTEEKNALEVNLKKVPNFLKKIHSFKKNGKIYRVSVKRLAETFGRPEDETKLIYKILSKLHPNTERVFVLVGEDSDTSDQDVLGNTSYINYSGSPKKWAIVMGMKYAKDSGAIGFHEIYHVLHSVYFSDDGTSNKFRERIGITEEEYQSFKKAMNGKSPKWTGKGEEKAALSWERYLRKGEAPTKEVASLFEKIKAIFAKVVYPLYFLKKGIDPSAKVIFDKMMAAVGGPPIGPTGEPSVTTMNRDAKVETLFMAHARTYDSLSNEYERLEEAARNESDPAKSANLRVRAAIARAQAQELDEGAGIAPKGNPVRAVKEKEQREQDSAIAKAILEAAPSDLSWKHWLRSLILPDYETVRRAYESHSTRVPRGFFAKAAELPFYSIHPRLYSYMRRQMTEIRKRVDLYQRKLWGRTWFQRVRYGGEGAANAPLNRIKENSKEAWRIALALDGGTVGDWNASADAVKKGGEIEGLHPKTSMVSVLNEKEKKIYDQVKVIWSRFRKRMFDHIHRHDRAFFQAEVERLTKKADRVREKDPEKADLYDEQAEFRQSQLNLLDQLRDPNTGRKWGFDDYFPHLWDSGPEHFADDHKRLPAVVQEDIPKGAFHPSLLRRKGRMGWSLNLHRALDIYIPAAEMKVAADKVLDMGYDTLYGTWGRATRLTDLDVSWHRLNRGQRLDMALKLREGEGMTKRVFVIPGSRTYSKDGQRILSIKVKDASTGEVFVVYRNKKTAKAEGVDNPFTPRDFFYRSGGVIQASTDPARAYENLEYMEKWVRRSLGHHPDYGKVMKRIQAGTRILTEAEYHAYIGALYPKAGVVNVMFGIHQLASEVGVSHAMSGLALAAKILRKGPDRSDRVAYHYFRIIREAAPHLESLVGFASEGERGLGRPRSLKQKIQVGANKVSFSLFRGSEGFIRVASFLGGYRMAEAAGASKQEAIDFGREVVARTQFDMGTYAAPAMVDHPLGYPFLMLRRYGLSLARQAFRGYSQGAEMVKAEVYKKLGKTPASLLRGTSMTTEEKKVYHAILAKRYKYENFHNSARLARFIIMGALIKEISRKWIGRDPSFQVSASINDVIGTPGWVEEKNGPIKAMFHAPIYGLTGPFEALPVQGKVAFEAGKAMLDRLNGQEYAITDFYNQNMNSILTRTGRWIHDMLTAEDVGDGKVLLRRGPQANFKTTKLHLIEGAFVPGVPVEEKQQWDARDSAYAESTLGANRRLSFNRLITSDDPADVQKAVAMSQKYGILPDFDSLQRRTILYEFPASVRQILTGGDKNGMVRIATKLIPGYDRKELRQAFYLLGANDPDWYLYPNGTLKVTPDVLKGFYGAVRQWQETNE